MNYPETLDYLFSRLPMFHRIGAAAYKADLKNTLLLCEMLDHPEKKFKSIHIAGTNGKGSTSHMLAAIFQSAGYKTGLYTSPHLVDFRERIRINGQMIGKEDVISFVEKYKDGSNSYQNEKIELSFFEWTVGLCFDYFAREKVDIAIIETGLGGRLDSTNVINPELSLITNISLDHTNLLGKTVREIAIEKAGIIKKNIPVIIGESNEAVNDLFIKKAKETESKIYFASENTSVVEVNETPDFQALDVKINGVTEYKRLELDLTGIYQRKNISGVLMAASLMRNQGWNISHEDVTKALRSVKTLTGLEGRWQLIKQKPLTICDVAHNEAGIKEIVMQISKLSFRHLHFVLGMVNDKDISGVLALLPKHATYYFCKAAIPRAMEANELKNLAADFNLTGRTYNSVASAFVASQIAANENDLVFVGGSTFVVAEVLAQIESAIP
jgi:dihydrofolate synthase/folylpolyglutamate synthase